MKSGIFLICTAPWQVMDIYDSVDDMWSFGSSILHECLDTFVPVCSVQSMRSDRPTPWLTPSLLSAIKQKKQAKRKAQQTNSDEDVLLYKQLKNNLKCLVQEAKINYVKTLMLLCYLFLLLSTLPVRHWRVYTEGRACSRCLPIA